MVTGRRDSSAYCYAEIREIVSALRLGTKMREAEAGGDEGSKRETCLGATGLTATLLRS